MKNEITIMRGDVFKLNEILKTLKSNSLSKEGAFVLLDIKIALSHPMKDITEAQKMARENFKPEGTAEGEMTKSSEEKWLKSQWEYMNKYLSEQISISLPWISQEDIYNLVKDNGINLGDWEFLNQYIGKNE